MMREEVYWMAVNVHNESLFEPLNGKIAVHHVVMNRARKRGLTIKEVIFQPMQFSWYNRNSFPPLVGDYRFYQCIESVYDAINERSRGIEMFGADHYFNPSLCNPPWHKKMEFIARIGNHDFYKDK